MSKKITAVALAVLMLALALPANAAIQATSVEIRGTVAQDITDPSGAKFHDGMLASENASWNAYNFAGFYYNLRDDVGTESLSVTSADLSNGSRTIQVGHLTYQTQGQPVGLYVVQNGHTDGLLGFDEGQMSGTMGSYNVVGWQAQPYVGIKNHSNKLAKLIIEQGNSSSEKKTLITGETWDIGSGWMLKANSIDAKASPRQLWLTLSKDGIKKDDTVIQQGKVYTYMEKNIGGESDVPLFVTYIDSVFAGATSDMVQMRYTWAVDTSITEVKGGDNYGVFKVIGIEPIILNNTDTSVTLSKDTTIDLMGELKFKVADSDTVRFYPMVQYQVAVPTQTPTPVSTPIVTPTPQIIEKIVYVNVTVPATAAPTAAATTQKTPGFEAVFAIAGLLAVAYLVLRQRK